MMKKILPILLSILMALSLAACAGNSSNPAENGTQGSTPATNANENENKDDIKAGKKVLVAYFSATGTTKKLAEYAANAVDADIYEIVPQQPYTSADLNYSDRNSRSTKEMNDKSSRPAINGSVKNMADYDVVFIGYPIWWGEAPRIISTFMESYDFSGKTIVPFCTSNSSGLGSSARNLHSLASASTVWTDGERFGGSASRNDIVSWINGLGLEVKAE